MAKKKAPKRPRPGPAHPHIQYPPPLPQAGRPLVIDPPGSDRCPGRLRVEVFRYDDSDGEGPFRESYLPLAGAAVTVDGVDPGTPTFVRTVPGTATWDL